MAHSLLDNFLQKIGFYIMSLDVTRELELLQQSLGRTSCAYLLFVNKKSDANHAIPLNTMIMLFH